MTQAQLLGRDALQRHPVSNFNTAAASASTELASMSQAGNAPSSSTSSSRRRPAGALGTQKRPARRNPSSAKKGRCTSPVVSAEAPAANIDVPSIDLLAAAVSAIAGPVNNDADSPTHDLSDIMFFNFFYDLCIVPSLEAHALSTIASSQSPLLNQQFARLRISLYRNELLQQIFSQPSTPSARSVMSPSIFALYQAFLLRSQALGLSFL